MNIFALKLRDTDHGVFILFLKTILCVKRPRRQFKSTKTHDIFKPKRNIQSFRLVGLVYYIEIMNIV